SRRRGIRGGMNASSGPSVVRRATVSFLGAVIQVPRVYHFRLPHGQSKSTAPRSRDRRELLTQLGQRLSAFVARHVEAVAEVSEANVQHFLQALVSELSIE